MRHLALVVGLAGVVVGARGASAATADGVMITAVASATFTKSTGVAMTVSYGATVSAIVGTPVVMLRRTFTPTIQASGGVLTFCVTYSNSGALASAFDVTITEAMPDNVKFVAGAGNYDTGTSDGLGTVYGAWSTNGGANWTAGTWPSSGQAGPVSLRWRIDVLSPKASGLVCYTVSVM